MFEGLKLTVVVLLVVSVTECTGRMASTCTTNKCLNGATCYEGTYTYSCLCREHYYGKRCEDPIGCNKIDCQNGGTCTNDANMIGRCRCVSGFAGSQCEIRMPVCMRNNCKRRPCRNGGKCLASKTDFQCYCCWPFHGERCEKRSSGVSDKSCNVFRLHGING